ncbi:MAG: hypothetical protein Q8P05_02305 [Candidatus Diapherotrites archaeon]|nr:hypothetical protein [Candidatus Diapherotrites archaeon]MDZ4256980.1 hypothetical protein [archaeon]
MARKKNGLEQKLRPLSRVELIARIPKVTIILIFLIAIIIASLWIIPYFEHQGLTIRSYNECVTSGFEKLDTFPPQCRTPDGRLFAQPHEPVVCLIDDVCGKGYFCKLGLCAPFVPETFCRNDADCRLINRELYFSCCYAGTCDPLDYGNQKWVAANTQWFFKNRQIVCPFPEKCGDAPVCNVKSLDTGYQAKCIQNACQKVPITPPNSGI